MAHAEASARTVDAAVTAAAAQLGLRSDQVDVEVLEDPVPSTFGFIGSPARVRVTPRATSPSTGADRGGASGGTGIDEPAESGSAGGESGTPGAGTELRSADRPSAQEPSTDANVPNDAGSASTAGSASASSPIPVQPAPAATETGNGQVPADRSAQAGDQLAVQIQEDASSAQEGPGSSPEEGPGSGEGHGHEEGSGRKEGQGPEAPGSFLEGIRSHREGNGPEEGYGHEKGPGDEGPGSSESVTGSATDLAPSPTSDTFEASAPAPSATSTAPTTSAAPDRPGPPTPAPTAAGPEAAASPSSRSTPEAAASSSSASVPPSTAVPEAVRREESGSSTRGGRPPRRTYKDEPIEPHMVEEDTERAGDFLEGLLDALDVDGDITTWVDEVGGHIDLEGTDLEVLVGPNGENLDALQELTRLAVLRQSKRRVRLLIDINGFRARQREQLTSMVQATVEQVIRTREDHELQPMSPAERKIVHDAVAAIDGARTESLGEDPYRRVVIRPA